MFETDRKPHCHVTAGVIWKDGKLLISKRAEGAHLAGFWEFPGGKQEPGEDLRQCLEREIREEMGIEARAEAQLLTVEHEYAEKRISLHVFNCTWIKGEPLALQCQEIRWVERDELSDFIFPPPDMRVIERLTKEKGGGSKEQRATNNEQPATRRCDVLPEK